MGRARWKLPYMDRFLFRYLQEQDLYFQNTKRSGAALTHARQMTVSEPLVHHRFGVHTGRGYLRVALTSAHVGYKLGSLVLTKRIGVRMHTENKLEKKKRDKARALKQKKLTRNKGRVKLKKSQKTKKKIKKNNG